MVVLSVVVMVAVVMVVVIAVLVEIVVVAVLVELVRTYFFNIMRHRIHIFDISCFNITHKMCQRFITDVSYFH